MTYCRPYEDKVLLVDRIKQTGAKSVVLVFFHGVGDIVMLWGPMQSLRKQFPGTTFRIGLPKSMTYETVFKPDDIVLLDGNMPGDDPLLDTFDIVVDLQFPMSEHDPSITKAEYSCKLELGCEPTYTYPMRQDLVQPPNRLCGVHFSCTCLPGAAGVERDVAERIWNDILAAGWIPIETHFQHTFHNPENARFDFVDASVRRVKPSLDTLLGLIRQCGAFIGVSSGNYHLACTQLPANRVMYVERDFKVGCYNRDFTSRIRHDAYAGEVYQWLNTLS